MAIKKYLDENGVLYLWGKIKTQLQNKVEKAEGKGLSTNDFSTAEKTKLTNIEAKAQVNKIEGIKVNGVVENINQPDKTVDIKIPKNISDLSNDSKYQTDKQVQELINKSLGNMSGIDYQVVSSLPQSGDKGIIYLVSNSGSGQNIYDEYIWVTDKFEKIGTTATDLSGYLKISDLSEITNGEIDEIVSK